MAGLTERTQTAKRQDLRNAITYADRKKTKFMTRVAKGSEPQNVLMEWPVDDYPSVRIEGVVDDQDASEFENFAAGRKLLYGRLQIFERKPKVSRLAQRVSNVAGVGKRREMAKSIAKALVMLKRDMEARMLSDDEAQEDNGNVGNETRGLGKWIQSTAQAYLPVPAEFLTPAASIDSSTTIANFTDDTVIGVMASIYDVTGDEDLDMVLWCQSLIKRAISALTVYGKQESGFDTVRRFNASAEKDTISRSIDLLETDFGNAHIVLNSFLNTGGDPTSAASKRLGLLTPMDMLEVRFDMDPSYRPLEDQGGGPRGICEAAGGLVCKNPKGFGAFRPGS